MLIGIIAASIAIGIIVTIIIIYIKRKRKGTLEIQLNKSSFYYGEKINGKLFLFAKKEIEGNNLEISLNCFHEIRDYDSAGNIHTRKTLVYTKKEILEKTKNYISGYQKHYDFTLIIPKEQIGETSKIGKVFSKISNIIGNTPKVTREIHARLDAKGLDLVENINLNISNYKI